VQNSSSCRPELTEGGKKKEKEAKGEKEKRWERCAGGPFLSSFISPTCKRISRGKKREGKGRSVDDSYFTHRVEYGTRKRRTHPGKGGKEKKRRRTLTCMSCFHHRPTARIKKKGGERKKYQGGGGRGGGKGKGGAAVGSPLTFLRDRALSPFLRAPRKEEEKGKKFSGKEEKGGKEKKNLAAAR